MSPNTDNATARLLFAILKQKNLKDIDWNLVAQDPVLLQPIPNGHAARMRYSRFRSTVLGQSQDKRSKSGDKGRISKPTKNNQIRKASIVKSESGVSPSSLAQFSPASTTSPYLGERDDHSTRFLTPCSDDMTAGLSMNPAGSDYLNAHDFMKNPNSPTFSAFDAAFDMGGYRFGPGDFHNHDVAAPTGPQALPDFEPDWNKNFLDTSPF